jgi:hypothetical protein
MQNSWDQQPKESSRAFSSFVAYRDLGLRRSCNAVARLLKLNPTSVLELCKRHNWQERVKAWDAHIDKETQQQQIHAVKIMKQRQIALALKAQKAAEKGIKRLIQQFNAEKGDGGISPNALKPDGLSRMLVTGCRLERLNRDEPEQNLELTKQQNFDNLSIEEVETYRALILKMGAAR